MLFSSIVGMWPKLPNFNGILFASLFLLLSTVMIPNVAGMELSEEQAELIREIKEFAQKLALENTEFDTVLTKSQLKAASHLKECLFEAQIFELGNDGTTGQIVSITEAYFKKFNMDMDGEYSNSNGSVEFKMLKEVTGLFKQFHLHSDLLMFLEEKIKIGSEGNAEAELDLFKRLHKFRVDASERVDAFLKVLWFHVQEKFIKELFDEIKGNQEPLKQEIKKLLEESSFFKKMPKIVGDEVAKKNRGFDQTFQLVGMIDDDNDEKNQRQKSPKRGSPKKTLASSSSLTQTNESDNEATLTSKRILKALLVDLKLLYEEQRYSEKFRTNLQSCEQIIQLKIKKSQNETDERANPFYFKLNNVCSFAKTIFEGIQRGIENALEEKMIKKYTQLRTKLMLNSMIKQMFYILLTETGINFEDKKSHHFMHYDEPFQGFALLKYIVKSSVEPNLLAIIMPIKEKGLGRIKIGKKVDVFSSVKECLAHSKATDNSPMDLYSLVMEHEEIFLLERVVDSRKSKHCIENQTVRIALNAFKTLALFRRLATFYNEMGQSEFIEGYEKNNEEKLFYEFKQIHDVVVANGCSEKLSEYIFDEFPKKKAHQRRHIIDHGSSGLISSPVRLKGGQVSTAWHSRMSGNATSSNSSKSQGFPYYSPESSPARDSSGQTSVGVAKQRHLDISGHLQKIAQQKSPLTETEKAEEPKSLKEHLDILKKGALKSEVAFLKFDKGEDSRGDQKFEEKSALNVTKQREIQRGIGTSPDKSRGSSGKEKSQKHTDHVKKDTESVSIEGSLKSPDFSRPEPNDNKENPNYFDQLKGIDVSDPKNESDSSDWERALMDSVAQDKVQKTDDLSDPKNESDSDWERALMDSVAQDKVHKTDSEKLEESKDDNPFADAENVQVPEEKIVGTDHGLIVPKSDLMESEDEAAKDKNDEAEGKETVMPSDKA